MIRNKAGQFIAFQLVARADGQDVTTGTPVCTISLDNGTQSTSTNSPVHKGGGVWSVVLTQGETDADHIVYSISETDAISQSVNVYPQTLDDYKATNVIADNMRGTDNALLSASAPANFASLAINGSGHISRVTTVDTTTENTDMRGTDSALLATSAPTNFSSLGINSSGHISRVTTVDTTTTNTDMRGTDSALLATSAPTNFAALGINSSGHILRTVLNDTTTTNTDMRGTDSAATATELANVPKRGDGDTYRVSRDSGGTLVQQLRETLHDSEQT